MKNENFENKKKEILDDYERKKEKELVNLIAKIIVDATFSEVYEKGNQVPAVQPRRPE